MKDSLNKELTLIDVFCVATGAMISSGLFILPGLAFARGGPAVVFSYLIGGLVCIPALLSMAELTTAMPRAGGDYFYIMRGFGPLLGTIAGFSSWVSLSLKGAFALVGVGAYLAPVLGVPLQVVALLFCLFFIVLNLLGVKEAGRLQVALVLALLAILLAYVTLGAGRVRAGNLTPFFDRGFHQVFATTGFIYVSYAGLNTVMALAEEVKKPGRNLPWGLMLSLLATTLVYTAVIFVTVGVLDPEALSGSLTPISDTGGIIGGKPLGIAVTAASFLAFLSTANSAIMTASRYPLGMSRDRLMPPLFGKTNRRFKTPHTAVLVTGGFMMLVLALVELDLLVKVASSILILLYILANLTLILFRESRIVSYRPRFRAPLYPWLQVFGILIGFFLLIEIGTPILAVTVLFLALGYIWYRIYARDRTAHSSALIYVLERLVARDRELASGSLLSELKDIVVQRDELVEDRFHRLIERAGVLDLAEPLKMEDFFTRVSEVLGGQLGLDSSELFPKFVERERESSTVIARGFAVPHVFVERENLLEVVLVRARAGVIFPGDQVVHILFVFVGSSGDRILHLKILAAIAQVIQNPDFHRNWAAARNDEELRYAVLLTERTRR
ncbi:MAG: amino acid permease [Spirochaetota bacterium]